MIWSGQRPGSVTVMSKTCNFIIFIGIIFNLLINPACKVRDHDQFHEIDELIQVKNEIDELVIEISQKCEVDEVCYCKQP